LKRIKNNPDISWSPKGELILKSKVIPNTHAIDLLNDLLRKTTKTPAPTGWKKLADVLKEHNIPRELNGNIGWTILIARKKQLLPEVRQRRNVEDR